MSCSIITTCPEIQSCDGRVWTYLPRLQLCWFPSEVGLSYRSYIQHLLYRYNHRLSLGNREQFKVLWYQHEVTGCWGVESRRNVDSPVEIVPVTHSLRTKQTQQSGNRTSGGDRIYSSAWLIIISMLVSPIFCPIEIEVRRSVDNYTSHEILEDRYIGWEGGSS